jgi:hypothetical protein
VDPETETGAETLRTQGSCLCGAVRFEITGPLRGSLACHCSQCRKTSGHYWSATRCLLQDLHFFNEEGLTWFRSPDQARRGFCRHCGASLFWQVDGGEHISIGSGTLDLPTGLRTLGHIFVKDKSDYVDIASGSPQWSEDRDQPPVG